MTDPHSEPNNVPPRQGLPDSFAAAWAGLAHAARTQRNMRIHIGLAVAVAAAAWVCSVSRWEASVLTIAVALVLVMELLNTSLEAAIDLCSPQRHPLARIAKDSAAAAVLVAAGASVIVGLVVFVPHLLALLGV
jgi:diacylglycerol kinase